MQPDSISVVQVEVENATQVRNQRLQELARELTCKRLVKVNRKEIFPDNAAAILAGNVGLNRPMYYYDTTTVDVNTVEVIRNDANGKSYVMLNKDPNLRFEIADLTKDVSHTLISPSIQTVSEAIQREAMNAKNITWFVDHESVTRVIIAMNEDVQTEIKKLVEQLIKGSELPGNINGVETTKCVNYYKQYGRIPNLGSTVIG